MRRKAGTGDLERDKRRRCVWSKRQEEESIKKEKQGDAVIAHVDSPSTLGTANLGNPTHYSARWVQLACNEAGVEGIDKDGGRASGEGFKFEMNGTNEWI